MPKNPSSNSPANKDDQNIDLTLRPTEWDEYIGQEKIKDNLKTILSAAKKRNEVPDHLLFSGPAGLGKTTLAYLVAREMGGLIKTTSGPALEKAGDLAAVLTNLTPGEILFIDEAHRVNPMIEEVLYPAMEARKLHLVVGKGPSARTLSLDLPPFTLIAATTRENLLSQPLRSRFGATLRLGYYVPDDIKKILNRFDLGRRGVARGDRHPRARVARDAARCQPLIAPRSRLRRSPPRERDRRGRRTEDARHA
jgi:Holliday junction DNA helicase RuvB